MNDKEKYTDPTLKDLIKIIWNSKISLISITAIVSICGVVYALSLPNKSEWKPDCEIQTD